VNNCKKPFHLEVASRDFVAEYKKLLNNFKSQPKLATVSTQIVPYSFYIYEFSLLEIEAFIEKMGRRGI
jgi:hypothetical protein